MILLTHFKKNNQSIFIFLCFLTFGLSQDSNKFHTLQLIWYVILSLLIYEFACFSSCHLFVDKIRLFVMWNRPHSEFDDCIFVVMFNMFLLFFL